MAKLDITELLSRLPNLETTLPFKFPTGKLVIRFTNTKPSPCRFHSYHELLQILDGITHSVTMTITSAETKNKPSQLTMSVADVLEILDTEPPSAANFTRICRRFLDRKHHGPTPPPYEPPERSMGAKGQTKKPGSHSDGRHG
jgi:hypothetical protein